MNRTKANRLVAALVLIIVFLLVLKALYNTSVLSTVIGAIIGFCVVLIFVFKTEDKAQTKEDRESEKKERALKKIKVQRTREGTTFEVATALILATSVVVGFATHAFQLHGSDNLLLYYVLFFIFAIAELILAYHPLLLTSPSLNRATNEEQLKLMIRSNRVYAILSALTALIISISPVASHLVLALWICIIIIMLGLKFLYKFLLKKNK